jgi:hypothetical protein
MNLVMSMLCTSEMLVVLDSFSQSSKKWQEDDA